MIGGSGLGYRALGADPPFGDPRRAHGIGFEGYYWRFTGASDHLVSEALYLNDPEGNGIEIYRDRPRDEWQRGDEGELQMATLPLDLEGVLGEVDGSQPVPAQLAKYLRERGVWIAG